MLIGTPAYGGQLTVGYFESCLAAADLFLEKGIPLDFLVTAGESHVTRARNNIVSTFLSSSYETLLFIDADIRIDANDVYRLSQMTGVRGAAVACKTPNFSEHLSIWPRIFRKDMPAKPFEVEFLGSAVLAIDRDVFERVAHLADAYTDPITGPGREYFRDGVTDGVWMSEDYGFCQLCNAADVPIVCDPSIVVDHFGSSVWRH